MTSYFNFINFARTNYLCMFLCTIVYDAYCNH